MHNRSLMTIPKYNTTISRLQQRWNRIVNAVLYDALKPIVCWVLDIVYYGAEPYIGKALSVCPTPDYFRTGWMMDFHGVFDNTFLRPHRDASLWKRFQKTFWKHFDNILKTFCNVLKCFKKCHILRFASSHAYSTF